MLLRKPAAQRLERKSESLQVCDVLRHRNVRRKPHAGSSFPQQNKGWLTIKLLPLGRSCLLTISKSRKLFPNALSSASVLNINGAFEALITVKPDPYPHLLQPIDNQSAAFFRQVLQPIKIEMVDEDVGKDQPSSPQIEEEKEKNLLAALGAAHSHSSFSLCEDVLTCFL